MSPIVVLGILVITAAVGIGLFTMLSMVFGKKSGLDDVLDTYFDTGEPIPEEERRSTSAVLKAAMESTEKFAEKRGVLNRISAALRAGQVPLRAGEFIMLWVVGGGLFAVGVGFLTQNLIIFIIALVLGMLVPPAIVKRKATRYHKRFARELPDMLNLMASTLRAGYSFMQGLEAVATELDEGPVADELDRLITETRLGRPMDDALQASADRVDVDDWSWSVMAIQIQREVGGNLAELLITVAETMIARERLRRDILSLTAEGRISAYMLGSMPPILGVVMWVINPEYIGILFTDTRGWIAIAAGVVGIVVGFLWMNKIIKIEV